MIPVDPAKWEVTILPLPKRFSRGNAYGFCGGHPVGRAEIPRGNKVIGCWWPAGKPEPLVLEGRGELKAGGASGDVIPGSWNDGKTGAMRAVVWRLRDGKLDGAELHDPAYDKTWATGAGGGAVIGVGSSVAKPGQRTPDVGLVWRAGAAPTAVRGAGDVHLFATDGTRFAGSTQGRATLWPSLEAAPIDLTPEGLAMSEIQALDGDLQIGTVWKGWCPRAAIWRGSAASFTDLTPTGFEAGSAYDGAHGYQVGFVRVTDNAPGGTPGSDNRAVLWQGTADNWFDLNALLPAKKYNASAAWAIDVRDGVVRVCGSANRYEAIRPGTPHESHVVPVAHPVLWKTRLR
jgi:hypothetical protein